MPQFQDRTELVRRAHLAPLSLKSTKGKASAPEEIKLFGWGENATVYGTFILDEKGAGEILAAFEKYGNDLAIDYEHQTFEVSAGPVPVAGWVKQGALFTKEGDEGGLFAKVEWTAKAKELIEAKEYRYTSPVFVVEVETSRVVELQPIALVNYPATMGMQPLIAAKGTKARDSRRFDRLSVDGAPSFDEVRTMLDRALMQRESAIGGYAWVVEVFDAEIVFSVGGKLFRAGYRIEGTTAVLEGEAVEVQRVYTATEGEGSMKITLKALGLPEGTKDEDLASAVVRDRNLALEVLTLSGVKDHDEARGALAAVFAKAKRHDELAAELATVKLAALDGEEKAILDDAVAALKLTPAEAEEMKARPGAKTEAGIKWLKGYVAKLAAKAPNAKTGEGEIKPKGKAEPATSAVDEATKIAERVKKLTARQKRMAQSTNVTLESFAASLIRREEETRRRVGTNNDEDGGDAEEDEV